MYNNVSTKISDLPDYENLIELIQKSVKSNLKAPLTAVFSPADEIIVKKDDDNNSYSFKGVVNSQNGYGAMIANNYEIKAKYENGTWKTTFPIIGHASSSLISGSFIANFIIISIVTFVLGLLGYLALDFII